MKCENGTAEVASLVLGVLEPEFREDWANAGELERFIPNISEELVSGRSSSTVDRQRLSISPIRFVAVLVAACDLLITCKEEVRAAVANHEEEAWLKTKFYPRLKSIAGDIVTSDKVAVKVGKLMLAVAA